MTFDPFGDFSTEGYLRNFEKEKDLAIVKRAENASFTTGLDEAFASLAKAKTLSSPRQSAPSHQLQTQFAANDPRSALKAFDRRTAVLGIEQAVDLRTADFH